MVLVDTSVWIDLFNGAQTRQTGQFEKLIELNDDICINGIIYTEILQGIRDDHQYNTVKQILKPTRMKIPFIKDYYTNTTTPELMLRSFSNSLCLQGD